MNYLSPQELDRMIQENQDFQLIDVRESYEYEDANIGGINIPLGDILDKKDNIDQERPVVFCCKSGKRSAAMTHTLERKFGLSNLFTLEGGIESYWAFKQ